MNHKTAFKFKQRILWAVKCSYTVSNTQSWKCSFMQPVQLWPSSQSSPTPLPVTAASALQPLLQPLISAGQFTYRNALSKSQAGLQFIFKKILVFSASCNSQLPGNIAKRCCPQINEVTTWDIKFPQSFKKRVFKPLGFLNKSIHLFGSLGKALL